MPIKTKQRHRSNGTAPHGAAAQTIKIKVECVGDTSVSDPFGVVNRSPSETGDFSSDGPKLQWKGFDRKLFLARLDLFEMRLCERLQPGGQGILFSGYDSTQDWLERQKKYLTRLARKVYSMGSELAPGPKDSGMVFDTLVLPIMTSRIEGTKRELQRLRTEVPEWKDEPWVLIETELENICAALFHEWWLQAQADDGKPTPAEAPGSNGSEPSHTMRHRGPAANMERHRAIRDIVAQFGNDWPKHLSEIGRLLHAKKDAVPPKSSWANRKFMPARTWPHAVERHPDLVRLDIRYSLATAKKSSS